MPPGSWTPGSSTSLFKDSQCHITYMWWGHCRDHAATDFAMIRAKPPFQHVHNSSVGPE